MNTIIVVILCKNEGYELGKCLKENQLVDIFGGENVLVIDSSDGEMLEVERMICHDFGVKFIEKKIGGEIKGIGDLRNYAALIGGSEWVLYIDVDELFSDKGLKDIGKIIIGEYAAYKFPRINLPWYEGYPDYQTRLVNVGRCMWIGDVHESVGIIENVGGIDIKGGEFGVLKEYPIIHKDRGMKVKESRNLRWNDIGKKNVLICSLFRDSELYMDRFLECIKKINKGEDNRINIELCFIEGNSTDNTWEKLRGWCNKCGMRYTLEKMDINMRVWGRFDKLAILRNMLIKVGLRSRHDYVLMVDSDCIFEEDLLFRMITSIENSDADVIGAMIMIENFRTFGNNYFYDTLAFIGDDGNKFVHYFPYTSGEGMHKVVKRERLEMKSIGTCYLVRGEVYNLNDLNWFNVTKCYKEAERGKKVLMYKGEKKSEQIRWCDIVRDAGYKVMIDPGIKVLHLNLEKYGLKWH